jgi:hypothetical protein
MASQSAGPVPQAAAPAPAAPRATWARLASDFWGVLAVCLGCAELGLWFAPFVLAAGLVTFRPRSRGVVPVIVAGAVGGWAIALWLMALDSLPVGATARSIAALAGLPPYAAVAIAVTLLLAALQALAGIWLARAVFPRQVRLPFPRRHPQP